MKKTLFIKNAVVLTSSSVILRLLGIVFKIWVASLVGSEGMGLYQIVMSVYFLFAAFSVTGICTAVTRLCADNMTLGLDYRPILKKCIFLSVIIGFVSSCIMVMFSRLLSGLAVGDTSVSLCFCVLGICLPVLGISSCLRGYFISVRRVTNSAVSQITEQLVRIAISYFLVKKIIVYGASVACLALVIGDTTAELLCPLLLFIRYKSFSGRMSSQLKPAVCSYKNILHIAFPLTAGRYLSMLLRTAENLLVPRMLSKRGIGIKGGLSIIGSIKAMTLPLLLFPSGFLNAVSTLLVPEISSSLCKKRYLVVKDMTERIVKLTMITSFIFACLFADMGNTLGKLLFKSDEVGFLITVLSPIVPLMYLDSIADGILKGLDCQKFSFYIGVADSLARVILVIFLLPRYGIAAFILIMYASNFLTAFSNIFMLLKKSRGNLDPIKTVFIPLCTALVVTKSATFVLKNVAVKNSVLYVLSVSTVSFAFYFSLLFLFGCLSSEEIRDLIT